MTRTAEVTATLAGTANTHALGVEIDTRMMQVLCIVLGALDSFERAVVDYQQATDRLEAYPEDSTSSEYYRALEVFAGARADFEAALKRWPRNPYLGEFAEIWGCSREEVCKTAQRFREALGI